MLTAVALLLIAALGGAALASGFGLARGARTIFMSGPVVTATPQSAVTAAPIGTPVAQATVASAPPALTLSPSPLVLLQQDTRVCRATQTIANHTSATVGWSWEPQTVDGFAFQVNQGPQVTWPSNRVPGIPPGGSDTLSIRSDCTQQAITVHLTDTLGSRYSFALTVREQSDGISN
jgi:hypothetical protein